MKYELTEILNWSLKKRLSCHINHGFISLPSWNLMYETFLINAGLAWSHWQMF